MKLITCKAAPITTTDGRQEVWETKALILWTVRNDQRFNSDGAGIRAGVRVEDAVAGSGSGGVRLEDAHWELVRDSLEKPRPVANGAPYPCNPAARLAPYIDEVSGAEDVKPEQASEKPREKKNGAAKTAAEA